MSLEWRGGRRAIFGVTAVLAVVLAMSLGAGVAGGVPTTQAPKPTIVLVHGAWAEPSGWKGVVERLQAGGFAVVTPTLTLRGLASDAATVTDVLATISGPIVLVGHSYGGAVITNAAADNPKVKALVYIAAFVPDVGETVLDLAGKNPGSTLPLAITPVPSRGPSGLDIDLYINPLLFRYVFTSDEVAPEEASAMAATQRPITLAALNHKTTTATWRTIPSWFLVAGNDNAIPPATQRFEAKRAKSHTVEIESGHAAMVSHPGAVSDLVLEAANHAHSG